MTLKEYTQLISYMIIEEKYRTNSVVRTISRLRSMDKELFRAFEKWLRTRKNPVLEINGVTFEELVEEEGMRPIRAFLMLDWFKKDPEGAYKYMKKERYFAPIQPLTPEMAEELDKAKETLKGRGVDFEKIEKESEPEDDNLEIPKDDESAEMDVDIDKKAEETVESEVNIEVQDEPAKTEE